MSTLSQFTGGGTKIGDVRPLYDFTRPVFFTEDGQDWLKTGSIVSYTAAYSEAASKGLGVNYILRSTDRLTQTSSPQGAQNTHPLFYTYFWDGTYYKLLPPPASTATNANFIYNTVLTSAGTATTINASWTFTGFCNVGNTLVFSTNDTTANQGLTYSSAGATTVTNSTGSTAAQYAGVASNGTNLAVAIARDVASNATNGIQTSTNGTSWTPRTGTSSVVPSGAAISRGIHYAAHLGRFLHWGSSITSFAIVSSTDGFTHTTSLNSTDYGHAVAPVVGVQFLAASSPSATLISARRLSDGVSGFIRTTDGTTWTFTSPSLNNQPEPGRAWTDSGFQLAVQWDSVRSRFVASIMGAAGLASANIIGGLLYTSTDGITWTTLPLLADDVGTANNRFQGFSLANGQDLASIGAASVFSYAFSGAKITATPSHIGYVQATTTDLSRLQHWVRIK